jgi:hypothetical protein
MCSPEKSYYQKCFQQGLNLQPSNHETVQNTSTLYEFHFAETEFVKLPKKYAFFPQTFNFT